MEQESLEGKIERLHRKGAHVLKHSGRELKSIPETLFKLTELRELYLDNNQLKTIPSEIGNLTNLTKLLLYSNQLKTIPAELGKLTNLATLDLYGNQLTNIPGELRKLTKLTMLYLNSNKLKRIPSELGELKRLTSLHLDNNQLTSIPAELGKMTKLTWLDLHNNQLTSIPAELGKLTNLDDMILSDNEALILPPPEIVKQGTPAILNYLRELSKEIDYLYEAKLLLVGEERAGKSCLAEALTNPNYVFGDKDSTYGIVIIKWILPKEQTGLDKDFRLNVWDFGGQEIYHSTHQFFITKRSIYFLVTEARKDVRHDDFYYWLNVINILGSKSPVVIIQNKCDQPSVGLAVREYQERFGNIVESPMIVSCKDEYKEKIESLNAATIRIIRNKELLPDVGTALPKVWVDIRVEIENELAKKRNYISYEDYVSICKSFGMNEERSAFLSEFFHDLGVFLHFKDDLELKKTVFLNHEWVLRAVYNVLDNKKVIRQHGVFDNSDLEDIWHEEQFHDKQAELLGLMRNEKFELCFDLGHGRYLAPKLLPEDVPDELYGFEQIEKLSEPLHHEYRYKFMPKGILTRLIVRLNKYVYKNTYWRYGALLEFDNTRALVRERYFDRKIGIVIEGENKKEMLGIIRKNIKDINDNFENLEVSEMIPCNCSKCRGSTEPYYFKLESLKRRLREGQRKVQCDESYENMNIHEILGNVVVYEKDKKEDRIIFTEQYFEKGDKMKINKMNITGQQVVVADTIDNVDYHESLGISNKELDEFKAAIKALSEDKLIALNTQYEEFRDAETEEKKKTIAERIKNFLIKNGVEVARSLTVEALKMILMPSK